MAATLNPSETPVAIDAQERAAREFLAQGRFRKARDGFKLLCKIDRPKFLPLLVEANIKLAREMAGKGMVSEAQQVLSYLKTIVASEQLLALELELGASSATPGQGCAVMDILKTMVKPALAGSERQSLADWVVLSFEPVPPPPPELAAVAQELEAIVSALRAVSGRQFSQALELVRPLGQASVFSHWKAFIKGLGAFYCGDSVRAARFFAGLPAGSAPEKAGRSYLLLLGSSPLSNGWPLPSEAAIEWAGRLTGEPGLGGALLRAEQAWRKANPAQMYQSLRTGIPRFPGEGLDLIGVLSEFAANCIFTLPRELLDNYDDLADEIIDGERAKSPVELLLFLRATVLSSSLIMPDEVLVDYWEEFLRTREQIHGRNPALDSLGYGWLGQLFCQTPSRANLDSFPFRSGSEMRNAPAAQRFLEKAVDLDEANLSASLSLCEVYQERRLHSHRNRLLDRMTARFPAEKKVLMLAGQACLERKAYKRGLDYLAQALMLDRLDPAIPDNLVKAHLLQAREYFQKSRPDDAQKALAQTAPFEVSAPGNLTRSRWCLRIQQGLMESTWGDQARGATLLAEGRRESPGEPAFLYYAGFADVAIKSKTARGSVYFDEFARLKMSGANAAQAAALTRIWLHGKEWLADRLGRQPSELLDEYLLAAAAHPFAREDGCRLVEFCLAEDDFTEAAINLVEKRLKEDARDPLFRLYRLRLRKGTAMPHPDRARIELEDILAEATRRKEDQTVRQVRQQLDALKLPPPLPADSFGDELPPEDEFDDDSFPDLAGDIPLPEQLLGGLPPQQKRMLEDILGMIANAPEADLDRLKQTRPCGMSAADFDLLVALAQMKRMLPNAKFPPGNLPPPRPHPPKNIPPPDPNQADLF